MNRFLPVFFICFFILIFADAQSQVYRHYTCFHTHDKITADGIPDEPAWKLTSWSDDFTDITGKDSLKPGLQTRVKILWDDEYVWFAAELKEPHIWANITKRDEVIFRDNDFEIFIDPDGDGLNYYELEINAFGTVWDLMLTKAYKFMGKAINEWNIDGLKSGVHINGKINDPSGKDSSWTVEIGIPYKFLMNGQNSSFTPADGVQWRLNFSRVEWKTETDGKNYRKLTDASGKTLPEQNWSWSPMGEINMHLPDRWGWLEFSSEDIIPEKISFNNDNQKKNFSFRFWIDEHSSWKDDQWDSVFRMMKDAGVSAVMSQAGPVMLRKIIPIAEKYNIRVEKWFVTMLNNDAAIIKEHPEWYVVSREGKSCVTDPAYVGYYRFMCPSNADVHKYLRSKIAEYTAIPGLYAVHLDYIRYPDVILPEALWPVYGIVQDKEYAPYDYCYCDICRTKFREKYGDDPLLMRDPEKDERWRQFRYDQITSVVNDLADECHKSGKKLTAAVFPGPSVAKQIVRQQWDRWPLDEVMPMLYHSFYYGSLDWIRKETAEGVKSVQGKPFFSGLYIPSLNPRELQSAIKKAVEGGADGVSLFNFEAMTPEHWKVLKQISATK